jgi:hypothetical protein
MIIAPEEPIEICCPLMVIAEPGAIVWEPITMSEAEFIVTVWEPNRTGAVGWVLAAFVLTAVAPVEAPLPVDVGKSSDCEACVVGWVSTEFDDTGMTICDDPGSTDTATEDPGWISEDAGTMFEETGATDTTIVEEGGGLDASDTETGTADEDAGSTTAVADTCVWISTGLVEVGAGCCVEMGIESGVEDIGAVTWDCDCWDAGLLSEEVTGSKTEAEAWVVGRSSEGVGTSTDWEAWVVGFAFEPETTTASGVDDGGDDVVVSTFPAPIIEAIAVAMLPPLAEVEDVVAGEGASDVVGTSSDWLVVGTITELELSIFVGSITTLDAWLVVVSATIAAALDVVVAGAGASRIIDVLEAGLVPPLFDETAVATWLLAWEDVVVLCWVWVLESIKIAALWLLEIESLASWLDVVDVVESVLTDVDEGGVVVDVVDSDVDVAVWIRTGLKPRVRNNPLLVVTDAIEEEVVIVSWTETLCVSWRVEEVVAFISEELVVVDEVTTVVVVEVALLRSNTWARHMMWVL